MKDIREKESSEETVSGHKWDGCIFGNLNLQGTHHPSGLTGVDTEREGGNV